MFKLILLFGIIVSFQDNTDVAYINGEVTCLHTEREYYLDGNKWEYNIIKTELKENIGVYLVDHCYFTDKYDIHQRMTNADDFFLTKKDGKFSLKGKIDGHYKIIFSVGGRVNNTKYVPIIAKDKITNVEKYKIYYTRK